MTKKILTKKVKAMNRHWKNYIDKAYLGSHNLESGEEMLLTIAKFDGEEKVKTADGEKVKQVLYFNEDVQKMILNITNANTIANLYGTHPDAWVGKKIQIYATPVKAFGKTQDALRIRDFVPKYDVDTSRYKAELDTAESLDMLKAIWVKFPASVRNEQALIEYKDVIKNNLSK